MAFFGLLRAFREAALHHTVKWHAHHIQQPTDWHHMQQPVDWRPIDAAALLQATRLMLAHLDKTQLDASSPPQTKTMSHNATRLTRITTQQYKYSLLSRMSLSVPLTGEVLRVRPERHRAQSCPIALRSPAPERSSDLNDIRQIHRSCSLCTSVPQCAPRLKRAAQ